MGVENLSDIRLMPKKVVCDMYACLAEHIPEQMVFDADDARRSAQAAGWFAPLSTDNKGFSTWCPKCAGAP